MHVQLRLQNHGCKRHPFWWIVAAPAHTNIKGRFIEHVGYWIPNQKKIVDRSVILNKPRIKYWLANGAEPTRQIQKFLSWIDLLPKPIMKYGSKTCYDIPKKPIPKTLYHKSETKGDAFDKNYFDRILEYEDKNVLKRKILLETEKVQEITSVELESQWNELRAKLYQHEQDQKSLNPLQRENLFRSMNEIADKWHQEKQSDYLRQLRDQARGEKVTDKNVKERLVMNKLVEEMEKQNEKHQEWFDNLKPFDDTEALNYINLMVDGDVKKIQSTFDAIKIHSQQENQPMSKQFIDEYFRYLDKETENQQLSKFNHFDLRVEDYSLDEFVYIPVKKPIHPLPDFNEYIPEEYTDILKDREQLIKNKAFSIPNIHLEGQNDSYTYDIHLNTFFKHKPKGRYTRPRQQFHANRTKIPKNIPF